MSGATTSLNVRHTGEHPGFALRRELTRRGWTQAQLAEILDRPVAVISALCNAKKAVTAQTAQQLEAAFGIAAEAWLYAQADHELTRVRQRLDDAE